MKTLISAIGSFFRRPASGESRPDSFGATVLQDLHFSLRTLRKNPGFAAAAICTLGLGIGANTAIFSVVYGVLLRPLPYAQGNQLVVLHQRVAHEQESDLPFSVKELADYRAQSHTLQSVVEHHSMSFLLFGKDSAERVETAVVSANFFDVLGVRPLWGRTFVESDEAHGAPAVLILSYNYWKTHQRGDPGVVGRVFQMNNRPHTVIGVLPPFPQYPQESDVYMPTSQCPTRSSAEFIADRRARMMTAFGRLKPGVTLAQAQADLSVVAGHVAAANPDVYPAQDGYRMQTSSLRDDLTRRARTMFLVLMGVAGFVLLIACANVANLLLARLLKQERELAVRAALGATRMRLLRQMLTESLLVSSLGGLLGLAFTPIATGLLVRFAGEFTQRTSEVRLDVPILAFTLLASIGAGLVFGLAPAVFASRWSGQAFEQAGSRTTMSRGQGRLRAALVVAQVAISVILLTGAGLTIRSFSRLQQVNPGFSPDRVLTMRLSLGFPPYTPDTAHALANRILSRLSALNGVESAALASTFPFNPAGVVIGPGADEYEIEGRPQGSGGAKPSLDGRIVSARYFDALRQPIVAGRSFTERDEHETRLVVVINQTMARHRFAHEDPVGRRIRFNQGMDWTPWAEIVGVAGDVMEYGLDRPASDEAYIIFNQGFVGRLVVRTSADALSMTEGLRRAIREIDPLIAIDKVETIERAQYVSMASPRLMIGLLGVFAALAVVISCSGIASVMALSVRRRTREIGVRMALGASQTSVVYMALREGLALTVAGTVLGLAGAGLLTRLLAAFLYGTSPTDPLTFVAVPVVFLLVSLVASCVPAKLATAVDPMVALRGD